MYLLCMQVFLLNRMSRICRSTPGLYFVRPIHKLVSRVTLWNAMFRPLLYILLIACVKYCHCVCCLLWLFYLRKRKLWYLPFWKLVWPHIHSWPFIVQYISAGRTECYTSVAVSKSVDVYFSLNLIYLLLYWLIRVSMYLISSIGSAEHLTQLYLVEVIKMRRLNKQLSIEWQWCSLSFNHVRRFCWVFHCYLTVIPGCICVCMYVCSKTWLVSKEW